MVEPEATWSWALSLAAPPMALPLEGVAGQGDAAGGEGAMESGPVNAVAIAPEATQAREKHLPVRLSLLQGRPVSEGLILSALTRHANERGASTDLKKHLGTL